MFSVIGSLGWGDADVNIKRATLGSREEGGRRRTREEQEEGKRGRLEPRGRRCRSRGAAGAPPGLVQSPERLGHRAAASGEPRVLRRGSTGQGRERFRRGSLRATAQGELPSGSR